MNTENTEESLPDHRGWDTFLKTCFPAEKEEDPEYLTTMDILERLNFICDDPDYSETWLFEKLQASGFKFLTPPPGGLYVWMVKSTPHKMIN
jgi:hypothetical protein